MLEYDQLAKEYAQYRKVNPEVLKHLLTDGQIITSSYVLEVGCGTGNYIAAIQAATSCTCWGIDPSQAMLVKAKEQSDAINFILGKAENLIDIPNDTFDLVFSVDVIHHMTDCQQYFREAQLVIRPGGKVCTITETDEMIRRRQPFAIYFPETVEVDLRRYPRTTALRDMMATAGFGEIQEIRIDFSFQLTDIQSFRDKAYSCLHLIREEALISGIQRMERDLRQSPINWRSVYCMLWGTKKDSKLCYPDSLY